MKTHKSLVWATVAVLALTFASTAFARGPDGARNNGTGGGDGLGWLRNTLRGVAGAISDLGGVAGAIVDLLPSPGMTHEQPHQ
jgi:hypothetical protein